MGMSRAFTVTVPEDLSLPITVVELATLEVAPPPPLVVNDPTPPEVLAEVAAEPGVTGGPPFVEPVAGAETTEAVTAASDAAALSPSVPSSVTPQETDPTSQPPVQPAPAYAAPDPPVAETIQSDVRAENLPPTKESSR